MSRCLLCHNATSDATSPDILAGITGSVTSEYCKVRHINGPVNYATLNIFVKAVSSTSFAVGHMSTHDPIAACHGQPPKRDNKKHARFDSSQSYVTSMVAISAIIAFRRCVQHRPIAIDCFLGTRRITSEHWVAWSPWCGKKILTSVFFKLMYI